MAPSSSSLPRAHSDTRPLKAAALVWQETMLARLPEPDARRIRLRAVPDLNTWSSARKHASDELDRLRDTRSPNPTAPSSIGLFAQEEARLTARLAELDSQEAEVRERQALQDTRPDGCWCLGSGGLGSLIAVLSDGLPLFTEYCPCPDGEQAREAAAWASEAVEADEQAEQQVQREQAIRSRVRDILTRAGIERRYERCTFDNMRELLDRRGYSTPDLRFEIDTREESYGSAEPLRGDYIWGDPGHGKTTLALACLRSWVDRGRSGRFINEGDFLDRVHASMSARDGEAEALLEYLKTAPLLVFDDLAMMVRTPYDRGKVVGLLVARHAANLLTIVTSNYDITTASLRLSGDDRLEHGRLEGRLREMCDEWRLVTGQLRTPDRADVPVAG